MRNKNSHNDFRDLLVRRNGQPWLFNPIKIGRFTLSIQASEHHYSEPRENGLSSKDYTHWEVALFFDDDWVKFRKWKLYYRGPWMKFHEGMDSGVFGYMPTEIVQQLYERIKLLDKLSSKFLFNRSRM